jgi:hypothetical protein
MISAVLLASSPAFLPGTAPAGLTRPAVHTNGPVMTGDATSRREFFATAGAALLAAAGAQSASAKAGETGKLGLFGQNDLSSPFQPGGPASGPTSTFGYKKTEGEFLANGYENDVSREKKSYLIDVDRIKALSPYVESKTWWYVRDEFRLHAYEMRGSMLAMNKVCPDKEGAAKAYKKFWSEVNALDLACVKKEPALAQKEYKDVLDAMEAYSKFVI